jgi:hypothetical protein
VMAFPGYCIMKKGWRDEGYVGGDGKRMALPMHHCYCSPKCNQLPICHCCLSSSSQVRFTVTHFRSSRLAAFSSLVGLSICLGGFHCTASEEGRFTIVMRLKRGSHCFQHHHEAYLERILFISSSQSSIAFARSPLSIARREGTRERSSQWSRARCAVHHVMCSIHDCGMFAFSCNESQLSE